MLYLSACQRDETCELHSGGKGLVNVDVSALVVHPTELSIHEGWWVLPGVRGPQKHVMVERNKDDKPCGG